MSEPVVWEPDAITHMWDGHKVTVDEANEALSDTNQAWIEPDPISTSGQTLRVVGYCSSRAELLVVILRRSDKAPGVLFGLNSWPANEKYRRIYEEGS